VSSIQKLSTQQICNNCFHITTGKPLKFSHHNAETESKQQWCIRRSARGKICLHCLGPSLNYTIIMPSIPSPNSLHSICTLLDNICQYITNQQHIQIKLGLTVHRCLQGNAPQYFVVCCKSMTDVTSHHWFCSATEWLYKCEMHITVNPIQ